MLEVLRMEASALGIEVQLQGAVAQRLAVVGAQEGHQQLPAEQGVVGLPLDVEEGRVRAALPPFQYVQPPGVAIATDGHMVGHDIQDQPHVMGAQGIDQLHQRFFTSQFGVDPARVDHVVAVLRARPGGEDRRGIQVADSQLRQVGHLRSGVEQGEILVQLQALRCAQLNHCQPPGVLHRGWPGAH
jgi:hypothetical protein